VDKKKRKIIESYILEYLKLKNANLEIAKKLFECPFKHKHENKSDKPTANIYPPDSYVLHCFDPACSQVGKIFDVVRKFEPNFVELSDDEIADYLIKLLKIPTDDGTEQLLATYHNSGFDLVPIKKNDKLPIEKNWTKKSHKNIQEWKDWLKAGLNIGMKTGIMSSCTTIDADLIDGKLKKKIYSGEYTKEEYNTAIKQREENLKKLNKILGDYATLTQETFGGVHLIFDYEKDIPKTYFNFEGIHFDIENDGGYILIAPSSVGGFGRSLTSDKISKMPEHIKQMILKAGGVKEKISQDEEIQEAINNDSLDKVKIAGLDGCCNATFVKLGGILRKKLNKEQTGYVLHMFNNMLEDPMERKVINSMIYQLDKYDTIDKSYLSKRILKHLEKVGQASSRDLRDSLKFEKEDIEDVLYELMKEEKVYRFRSVYKLMNRAEWKEDFVKESRLIDFIMPYFNDYGVFRNGDMTVIGAMPGVGKTHIAVNIMRKLVKQNKKPNYISLEAGNRFSQIAMAIGLKEGDFRWCNHYSPETIELEDNAITIIDWLLPDNYAETDKLYKKFTEQLDKHGGILIVFCQLKKDGGWFSPNMIDMFPSFAAKYLYIDGDSQMTCFETSKIRESKIGRQITTIPTIYSRETKLLELR